MSAIYYPQLLVRNALVTCSTTYLENLVRETAEPMPEHMLLLYLIYC